MRHVRVECLLTDIGREARSVRKQRERFGIAFHRQRKIRGDDAFGVVAGVDVEDALEAAQQETRAGEQD